MPNIICPHLTKPVTAAAADGTLTLNPTVENYFPGARCSIIDAAGVVSEEVLVVELVDSTKLRVRILADGHFTGVPRGPNYGYSDMSAFAGGKLTQHPTAVPVEFAYDSVFKV